MHVIFISNCKKNALPKTRRILDRYATRIGDMTWKTPITKEGLNEIHSALKRVATRQTAVACYRNKAMGDMELIWVVGNRRAYDRYGAYASGTAERKRPVAEYIDVVSKLARLGGYTHDIGKANGRFQKKLIDKTINPTDKVRHEWISAWILRKMLSSNPEKPFEIDNLIGSWEKWSCNECDEMFTDKDPWKPIDGAIDSSVNALIFSVATHHRLFDSNNVDNGSDAHIGTTNHVNKDMADKHFEMFKQCKLSSKETLNDAEIKRWEPILDKCRDIFQKVEGNKESQKVFQEVKGNKESQKDYWRAVALISRAALVMADHKISSCTYTGPEDDTNNADSIHSILWANTRKDENGGRVLNQPLTWHLDQVGDLAGQYARMFSGNGLPVIQQTSIGRVIKPAPKSLQDKFRWQDRAYKDIRKKEIDGPALVFNIANLGTGKTKANVKILAALRKEGEGLRITAGFNLRSLTLQTSDAYVSNVGLDQSEVACVIGSTISRKLHESMHSDDEDENDLKSPITHADGKAEWLKNLPEWFEKMHEGDADVHNKTLIGAPVLVTTMDHLISAGEPGQQASHPHALLRISNSDLIIDEADSYSTGGLIAVCRVIEMAAMFGRNVVVSSATLPDYIAETIHKYWESGIRMYQALNFKDSSENRGKGHVLLASNLCEVESCSGKFLEWYKKYAMDCASKFTRKRVIDIKTFPEENGGSSRAEQYVDAIIKSAIELHNSWHMIDEKDEKIEKNISIGLVRVANVRHCIEITRGIAARSTRYDGFEILVTPYHAHEVMARRSWKEKKLDTLLKRTKDDQWWNKDDVASSYVEKSEKKNIIFIVVATPVEEVGRDHHFDWGVIEPSSMMSVIQTIGRIGRHFDPTEAESNNVRVHVLNKNWRHFVGDGRTGNKNMKIVYTMPGYQAEIDNGVKTHQAKTTSGYANLTAEYLLSQNPKKPCIPENIMDMVFGEKPVLFYLEDKRSIEHTIEDAVNAANSDTAWMGTHLYKKYRLRDGAPNQSFHVEENGCIKESWGVYDLKKNGMVQHANCTVDHVDEEDIHGTWLCPSVIEVREFVDKLMENDLSLSESERFELWSFPVSHFNANDNSHHIDIHLSRLGATTTKHKL